MSIRVDNSCLNKISFTQKKFTSNNIQASSASNVKSANLQDSFETSSYESNAKIGILDRIKNKFKKPVFNTQTVLLDYNENAIALRMNALIDKEQIENYLNSDESKEIYYENRSSKRGKIKEKADKIIVCDANAAEFDDNVRILARALGVPMIIRGFEVDKNGIKFASNITTLNGENEITTYSNVMFSDGYYVDKRHNDSRFFSGDMSARYDFFAQNSLRLDGKDTTDFYLNYEKESYSNKDGWLPAEQRHRPLVRAQGAIEFLSGKYMDIYTNYEKYGDSVPSGDSEQLIENND